MVTHSVHSGGMRGGALPNLLDVVAAAARGDESAWSTLVDRYSPTVWAIARGYRLTPSEAAAVVQATWLRLVVRLAETADTQGLGVWLGRTARREALRLRRLGARDGDPDGPAEVIEDDASAQRERLVTALVEPLRSRSRLVLRLLAAGTPLSFGEIGAVLGIPASGVIRARDTGFAQLRRSAAESGVALEEVFR